MPSTIVKAFLFAYFVCIGGGAHLVAKASGAINYNVSLCILLVEATKWFVAWAWDFFVNRPALAERGRLGLGDSESPDDLDEEPYYGATVSWGGWLRYGAPAFLYAIGNNLRIYANMMIGPPLYALLSNTRILFAAVLGRWLLNQKLSVLQWAGLVNLVLACAASRLFKVFACADGGEFAVGGAAGRELLGTGADLQTSVWDEGAAAVRGGGSFATSAVLPDEIQMFFGRFLPTVWQDPIAKLALLTPPRPATNILAGDESSFPRRILGAAISDHQLSSQEHPFDFVFVLGVVLVLICGFISGASGSVNEFLLKAADPNVTLMRKNMYTYQWGVIFNLFSAIMLLLHRRTDKCPLRRNL